MRFDTAPFCDAIESIDNIGSSEMLTWLDGKTFSGQHIDNS
jgi:hypothetical protein